MSLSVTDNVTVLESSSTGLSDVRTYISMVSNSASATASSTAVTVAVAVVIMPSNNSVKVLMVKSAVAVRSPGP